MVLAAFQSDYRMITGIWCRGRNRYDFGPTRRTPRGGPKAPAEHRELTLLIYAGDLIETKQRYLCRMAYLQPMWAPLLRNERYMSMAKSINSKPTAAQK